MLLLQDISYTHPNKDLLFHHITLAVNQFEKLALVGNNGTGKSTLLKLLAGELKPAQGQLLPNRSTYYLPQVFGQFDHLTIAQALKIEDKLQALHAILAGNASEQHFLMLQDDWTIEERCKEVFNNWQLNETDLSKKMGTLSGGQKTKIFLAGIQIHQPDLILLDEPSNHLDLAGRSLLYDYIRSAKNTVIVVSHDKTLLRLVDRIVELYDKQLRTYGGNYDLYLAQKQAEMDTLKQQVTHTAKTLRKAKEKERETIQRQQKRDSRGKGQQEKAGVARIMMNTLRNSAENSTSKTKTAHAEKIGNIKKDLEEMREALPGMDRIRLDLTDSDLHKGKVLVKAESINYAYNATLLWRTNLDLLIASGERIALKGANGSGKTTLINMILGTLTPQTGVMYQAARKTIYIDQDYSLISNERSVYTQACLFNDAGLVEHEIKTRLDRFLFTQTDWDKPCSVLSGGERMRLMLCCLTISHRSPDIIVLDEPTNNLDIQNVEILLNAINTYRGTLLVVSHDVDFLAQLNIERVITLD